MQTKNYCETVKKGGNMEGTYIYEGTLMIEGSLYKVYLVNKASNTVVDLNFYLSKFIGEKVKVVVAKAEDI